MPKVTISLVTYRSEQYVRDFCASLLEQSCTDWELIVVDNASTDNSVQIIRDLIPSAHIVQQKENIGFSRAHNLIITWSKSQYILVVNADIIFEKRCLEHLVNYADKYPMVAAVGPKLLGWDYEAHVPTGRIDSAGIQLSKQYRASDKLQGSTDRDTITQRVFGLSGACVLYRRSALEEVKTPRFGAAGYEYFDEDFFAYKEDVDLAWRLNLGGYEQYVVAGALGYHVRAVSGVEATRHLRKKRSGINRFSYRNHLLMVYKNHLWGMTFRHLPSLLWFEASKFFYLLFLDGSSIRGLLEVVRLLPKFRRKRKLTQSQRRVQSRDLSALII